MTDLVNSEIMGRAEVAEVSRSLSWDAVLDSGSDSKQGYDFKLLCEDGLYRARWQQKVEGLC